MKMLVMLLIFAASIAAPAHAQVDTVEVEIDSGGTCPAGWTAVDRAWSRAARIYFTLPDELVDAWRRAVIGSGSSPVEFLVSQRFVDAVYPTPGEQQTAFDSGVLRSEPAASGSVRTCTLGP